MRKNTYLMSGICLLAAAAVLFLISISATVDLPPADPMGYAVLAFAIFGIYSGISSGKSLAYHLHDKDQLLKKSEGAGPASVAVGRMIRWPLIVSTVIFVTWSLCVLVLGFVWSAVSDRILLGHVRWALIISMGMLIMGAFMLFRSISANKEMMLTRKGRVLVALFRPTMRAAELADLAEELIKPPIKNGLGIDKLF